jgi:hypothetical protein
MPKINRSAAISDGLFRMATRFQPPATAYDTIAFVLRPTEQAATLFSSPSLPSNGAASMQSRGMLRLECINNDWATEIPLLPAPSQLLFSLTSRVCRHRHLVTRPTAIANERVHRTY